MPITDFPKPIRKTITPDVTGSSNFISSAPRALAMIGTLGPFAPSSYKIELNDHGQADQGEVTLPLKGNYADWPYLTTPLNKSAGDKAADLIAASQLAVAPKWFPVQIYAGFPNDPRPGNYGIGSLSKRFDGIIDQFKIAYHENTVTFWVRSYAALLVETKSTSVWKNATTVDVINSWIGKELSGSGMTLKSKLRSSQKPAKVEEVYGKDAVLGTRNLRLWDMLLAFAEADGQHVWCDGNVIYYYPIDDVDNNKTNPPWPLDYRSDLIDLEVIHSPTFNKNIEVEVRSYEQRGRSGVVTTTSQSSNGNVTQHTRYVSSTSTPIYGTTQVQKYSTSYGTDGSSSQSSAIIDSVGGARNSGFTTTPGTSTKERYVFHIPNLSLAACDKRALTIWHQLSEHEFTINAKFPVTPKYVGTLANGQNRVNRNTRFKLLNAPHRNVNSKAKDNSFYRAKRITETFEVSQTPGGNSNGWVVEINAVNHELPQAGLI